MTSMSPIKAAQFLTDVAASLRRMHSRFCRLDGNLVENDIAARRIEADIGWESPGRRIGLSQPWKRPALISASISGSNQPLAALSGQ
jgi:hypothetical protein